MSKGGQMGSQNNGQPLWCNVSLQFEIGQLRPLPLAVLCGIGLVGLLECLVGTAGTTCMSLPMWRSLDLCQARSNTAVHSAWSLWCPHAPYGGIAELPVAWQQESEFAVRQLGAGLHLLRFDAILRWVDRQGAWVVVSSMLHHYQRLAQFFDTPDLVLQQVLCLW